MTMINLPFNKTFLVYKRIYAYILIQRMCKGVKYFFCCVCYMLVMWEIFSTGNALEMKNVHKPFGKFLF
jgi:hypothetical protein